MRFIGTIKIKAHIEVGIEAKNEEEAKKVLEAYFDKNYYTISDAEIDDAELSDDLDDVPDGKYGLSLWRTAGDHIKASDYLEEE